MPSRNPDFATLSEAAYEAADILIEHLDMRNCHNPDKCLIAEGRRKDYRTKRDAALKALRGAKGGARG
jgi:uncharacterized protein YihD (DUF1040 family)